MAIFNSYVKLPEGSTSKFLGILGMGWFLQQMATFIDILKKRPDFREFLVITEGPKFEYQNMILGYTNTSHPIIHCMEEYLFQFCFTMSSHLWPWGPDPAVARSFSWFQWGPPLSPKPWSWDLKPITTWRPSSRRSMAAGTEGLVMAAWCPDCWGKTGRKYPNTFFSVSVAAWPRTQRLKW